MRGATRWAVREGTATRPTAQGLEGGYGVAVVERCIRSYISTRRGRGDPGPPGKRRAAINTKSTSATNARSGSTIELHRRPVRAIRPNRLPEYLVSHNGASSL